MNKNAFLGAMHAAGYNQKTLAPRMNMTVNTLSAKINGKSKFDTHEATLFCEICHVEDPQKRTEIFLSSLSQKRDSCAPECCG